MAELEMHVRAHPLREHGCELLALALYRAGRQAEALGVLRGPTLARWTREVGNLDRANELAAAVLGDFVQLYGADHRYTLVARS